MVDVLTDNITDIRVRLRGRYPLMLDGSDMDDAEFYAFCLENNELRIERDSTGKIIIMPPTTSEAGRWNSKIHIEIGVWNRMTKLGETFDSSTGFKLPNGAERSPDTAWIARERWAALPAADKRKFAPIVPDFVLELRSYDQSLPALKEKMEEYITCGCRLGWLVDPQNRCTYVYFENGDIQTMPFDDILGGGSVMPGLEIRMEEVMG